MRLYFLKSTMSNNNMYYVSIIYAAKIFPQMSKCWMYTVYSVHFAVQYTSHSTNNERISLLCHQPSSHKWKGQSFLNWKCLILFIYFLQIAYTLKDKMYIIFNFSNIQVCGAFRKAQLRLISRAFCLLELGASISPWLL